MNQVSLNHYLLVSILLFSMGAFGVFTRRHAVGVLMGIELMLNAANLNFVAFWRYLSPRAYDGQIFALMVITVAAAEAAVGLAIVLSIYRRFNTPEVDEVAQLKG